jgi:hypothetical protein
MSDISYIKWKTFSVNSDVSLNRLQSIIDSDVSLSQHLKITGIENYNIQPTTTGANYMVWKLKDSWTDTYNEQENHTKDVNSDHWEQITNDASMLVPHEAYWLKYKLSENTNSGSSPSGVYLTISNEEVVIDSIDYIKNILYINSDTYISNSLSNRLQINLPDVSDVYNNPYGSDTPPNSNWVSLVPELVHDSYLDISSNINMLEPPPGSGTDWHNMSGVIWFATGVSINSGTPLKIAQLTFKKSSSGTLTYEYSDQEYDNQKGTETYRKFNLNIQEGVIIII